MVSTKIYILRHRADLAEETGKIWLVLEKITAHKAPYERVFSNHPMSNNIPKHPPNHTDGARINATKEPCTNPEFPVLKPRIKRKRIDAGMRQMSVNTISLKIKGTNNPEIRAMVQGTNRPIMNSLHGYSSSVRAIRSPLEVVVNRGILKLVSHLSQIMLVTWEEGRSG